MHKYNTANVEPSSEWQAKLAWDQNYSDITRDACCANTWLSASTDSGVHIINSVYNNGGTG